MIRLVTLLIVGFGVFHPVDHSVRGDSVPVYPDLCHRILRRRQLLHDLAVAVAAGRSCDFFRLGEFFSLSEKVQTICFEPCFHRNWKIRSAWTFLPKIQDVTPISWIRMRNPCRVQRKFKAETNSSTYVVGKNMINIFQSINQSINQLIIPLEFINMVDFLNQSINQSID